jgi:hypothetical protein
MVMPPVGAAKPELTKAAGPPVPRLKAVQVLVEHSTSEAELRDQLSVYRDAGFDTVILRAFHLPGDRAHAMAGVVGKESYGVYFPTNSAPVIKNLMEPFVRLSRELGLRPFAWMVTRKARFGNNSLPHDVMYLPDKGIFRPMTDLDILDPASWPHIEGLFADLAGTGVEGILLQDDLASRMKEGFSQGNMTRYMEETGAYSPPWEHLTTKTADDGRNYLRSTDGFGSWISWKAEALVSLAGRLQEVCRQVNPDVVLVMNQMYESVTDPDNGRLWLSQDLGLALNVGPQYSAVMLYHDQIQRELSMELAGSLRLVSSSLARLERPATERSRVMLKFQTHSWQTGFPLPPAHLAAALKAANGGGWSLALVPPPTEEQIEVIKPLLDGL